VGALPTPGVGVSCFSLRLTLGEKNTKEKYLTPEGARQYAEIVSEPKRFKLYDTPHALNAEARRDRLAFLSEQLKVKPLTAAQLASIPDLYQPPEPTH
jgi:hypothetical protein